MSRVLIVDDEVAITEGLKALFELEDIQAEGAYDRETAEALMREGRYSVVLADLRLKTEEEGLLLLEHIRSMSPGTQVASMTGYSTPAMEKQLSELGSVLVLQKPVPLEQIVAAVRELLASSSAALEVSDAVLYQEVRRLTYSIPVQRFRLAADEADDVVQEAWSLFFSKRDQISNARAWLTGTLVNLCKQRVHGHVQHRDRIEDIDLETASVLFTTDPVSDEVLAVRQAISKLDERSRMLCTLIAIEGWSYDEVSAEMGLPIGSVGPLYIRAKNKLRKELQVTN